MLPVLAALVASGGPTPRLLKATAGGELLTSDNAGPSVQATVPSAAGQPQVLLPDTSPFHPGDVVNVTSGLVGGPVAQSTRTFVVAVATGSITLQTNLLNICNVGDVVTRILVIGSFGQPIGVSARPRAWDANSFSNPGAGIRANTQFTRVANLQWVITHAHGRIVAIAGVDGANFRCFSNTQNFFSHVTGCNSATGLGDDVDMDAQAARNGTVLNEDVVVDFQTAPQNASNFYSVSMGAYLTNGEPV